METVLIKEQYKVIRVLYTAEHFAAVLATDITSSLNEQCVLNIYDGNLLKPYLTYFSDLKHCPEFVELFVRDESVVAVFRYARGKNIDSIFYRGNKRTNSENIEAADLLIEKAISVADYPPNVGCPLLLSENTGYEETNRTFVFTHVIFPFPPMNPREQVLLLSDQLKKIIRIRYDTSLAARTFIRDFQQKIYESVPELSSEWHTVREGLIKEASVTESSSLAARIINIIKINVVDFFRRLTGIK